VAHTGEETAGDNHLRVGARAEELLDEVAQRSRATVRSRARQLRLTAVPVLQTAVAAGLAWYAAIHVIGHPHPIFAPIAAIIALGVSLAQRLRRAGEMVVGVALGILVGDLIVGVIGAGAWQIALVVTLAMGVAILVGGGASVVSQSASSAVLVVALAPPQHGGIYYARFLDSLSGGVIGLLVGALLLPVNPIVVARRNANPLLEELSGVLRDVARVLLAGDSGGAERALGRARALDAKVDDLREAVQAGSEVARFAPLRRYTRAHLVRYVEAVDHLDHTVRNVRVLARRALTMLQQAEPVPVALPKALRGLATAIDELRAELSQGVEPKASRRDVVRAVGDANRALADAASLSGNVVVAQVRSAATDLLRASGLDREDAEEAVRRAGAGG